VRLYIEAFRALLDDFTHHNVDVACVLLETCGGFLVRNPDTAGLHSRGLHSFPFQLNLSSSVHLITQLNS